MGYREDEVKTLISLMAIFASLIIGVPLLLAVDSLKTEEPVVPQKVEQIEGRVKTVYGIDGRPVNQSQNAKGYHRVQGNAKLQNGVDTIDLNTSTGDGGQDVTFIGDSTYFGMARAVLVNGHTYTIVPISGKRFVVVSSDTTDTATVRFRLEGE